MSKKSAQQQGSSLSQKERMRLVKGEGKGKEEVTT